MAWTTSHTFTATEVVTAATLNASLKANLNFLFDPPGAAFTTVHNPGASGVSPGDDWAMGTSTTVSVPLDINVSGFGTVTLWDTDTMHSNSVNKARLTVNTAGVYSINANIRWQPAAAGVRRRVAIFWNGSYHAGQLCQNNANTGVSQSVSATISATAADFFELGACQDSGGALDFGSATDDGTHELMSATWIGAG